MHLTKHHVFGNDFLVRLGTTDDACRPGWVRSICDRTTGVGADGVLWARAGAGAPGGAVPPGEPLRVAMRLYNADGSEAEVSGNGLASLAQALTLRAGRAEADVLVDTIAGERTVVIGESRFAGADDTAAGFGRIRSRAGIHLGEAIEADEQTRRAEAVLAELVPGHLRAGWVSVGNPHVVALLGDEEALDSLALEAVGAELQQRFEPVNFEAVAIRDRSRVRMRVFERGVGVTSACGSGAAAIAWRLRHWSLVDRSVEVEMPGGIAEVIAGEAVELRVPVIYVADIEAPEPARPDAGTS
jgi:diaminopimelate epimerase